MQNVAQVMQKLGRLPEAEAISYELLELQTRILGEGHLHRLLLLRNIGSLHLAQGQTAQAESMLNRAVEAGRISLPAPDAHLAELLTSRAVTRAALERYAEAVPDLLEAHQMLEALVEPGDGRMVWTIQMLVAVNEAWGRVEEAAAWRDRLSNQ